MHPLVLSQREIENQRRRKADETGGRESRERWGKLQTEVSRKSSYRGKCKETAYAQHQRL